MVKGHELFTFSLPEEVFQKNLPRLMGYMFASFKSYIP
jgi:hypothetical protein